MKIKKYTEDNLSHCTCSTIQGTLMTENSGFSRKAVLERKRTLTHWLQTRYDRELYDRNCAEYRGAGHVLVLDAML